MKKVKSSLSSSRLQYPLLMLLLLVMEGVSTVLTVMERSEDSLWHQNSTLAARGSDGLSRSDAWAQSESTRVQLPFTHPEIVCAPVLMHPEGLDPTCEGETGELCFDSALWVLPERRPGNARASNRRVTSSCHACECVRVTNRPFCMCT